MKQHQAKQEGFTIIEVMLVLAIAAYVIVSLMTRKPPQDVDELVDYAKKFEDTDITDNRTVNIGVQMSREQFEAVVGAKPAMA